MLTNLKRIVVVVGHYGSGKTNFSVNLAVDLKAAGRDVILVDLDIVNPYFRSADFGALLEEKGIGLIAPVYARSNLDVPALDGRLDAVIESDKTLVIDVGGDDAGAAALGRYSAMIREAGGCDVLYVVNAYRYLTRTSEEAAEILGEIERKARLEVTAVVNNSNLADITTADDIVSSAGYAEETARRYGIPVLCTTAWTKLAAGVGEKLPGREIYPVDIYVKKPWEV